MKKRILCLAAAIALLITMIPLAALEAKAASAFVASPELIEIIKKWEGFCFKPVWDYGQWTVGYGTKAPDEHLARYKAEGISEEEATELLRSYMGNMGKSVNSFIDKFGLKVTQGQFDAMLSITYNCGSRWMLEVGTLRTAVVDGWSGDDLLFAFGQWSTAGGSTLPGLVRRRMAEVNMYLNGKYDSAPPEDYCYVNFNANGGVSEIITQAYIAGDPVAIRASASYENCVFQGWYTDPTGGEKVEKLDASLNGYTLYAHWSAGEDASQPEQTPDETITGTPVSYTKQIASLTLNAFEQPVKGALVVDALTQYELVDIVAEYTDSTGVKWGKVNRVGWINLTYTQDPVQDSEEKGVTVIVTSTDVNIRRGPGTTYTAVGKANTGDVLVITQTATGDGYVWGKFNKGWIALTYTNYDEAVNGSIGNGGSQASVMGTVNVEEFLRIRSAPGVANAVVGMLGPNDRVEILEQRAVGGTVWGRIDKGWISLDYVILDKDETQKPEIPPVQTPPEETTPPETAEPDQTPPEVTTPPETTEPEQTTPEETTPPETTEPEQTPPEETIPPEEQEPDTKPALVTGKVKLTSGRLNIRTGPSTGYSVVDSYANGTEVTILEQRTVGTVTWGRTDKGWISLDYVKLDEAEQEQTPPVQTPPEQSKPEQTLPEQTQPEQKPAETNSQTGTVSLTSGCLRIRSGAGTNNAIVGNLYNGAKVTITERKTVNGSQWGKMDKGWICLDYVKFDAASDSNTGSTQGGNANSGSTSAQTVTGTVKVDDFLRIRSGAGTNYTVVGYYYKNNKVTITEQKSVAGTKWGRTDKGWICLDYVILDGQTDGNSSGDGAAAATGTVTGTGLRIRTGAGTNNRIVGSLTIGDKVTILETTTVNGTKWGRIDKGWICLDYVKIN